MTYIIGQHWFICDVCGQKYRSTEKFKRWDGLIVCPNDNEPDHPQKFVRVQGDGQAVPDPRPRPEDVFTQPVYCSVVTRTPAANIGVADCFMVDATTTLNYPNYGLPNLIFPVSAPTTAGAFWAFTSPIGSDVYTDTGGYNALLENDFAGSLISSFGGGSLALNSDILGELPAAISLGTGDFTVSFECYIQTVEENITIGVGGTNYNNAVTFTVGAFDLSNRGIYARLEADFDTIPYADPTNARLLTSAPSVGTWNTIKFERVAGTISLYLNGVLSGSRSSMGVDCDAVATVVRISGGYVGSSYTEVYLRNLSISRPV